MSNYELTEKGLVTSDPVIAAMFLGDPEDGYIYRIHSEGEQFDYGVAGWQDKAVISYHLVAAAIQPVEGEGFIIDNVGFINRSLAVFSDYQRNGEDSYYHQRVLNIVTTRAELRELIARCEESQG